MGQPLTSGGWEPVDKRSSLSIPLVHGIMRCILCGSSENIGGTGPQFATRMNSSIMHPRVSLPAFLPSSPPSFLPSFPSFHLSSLPSCLPSPHACFLGSLQTLSPCTQALGCLNSKREAQVERGLGALLGCLLEGETRSQSYTEC